MNDQFPGRPDPDDHPEPVREPGWWAKGQPTAPTPAPAPRNHTRGPRRPDPGTPGAARLATLFAIILILIVAVLQQRAAAPGPPPHPAVPQIHAPDIQFEVTAKVYTRIHHAMPEGRIARDAIAALEAEATRPEEHLRIAIIAAELGGPEDALDRLDDVEAQYLDPKLESDPEQAEVLAQLRDDVETLRHIYEDREEDLDPARIDALANRHGWFGQVAATYHLPPHDPQRQQLIGGGFLLIFVLGGLMLGGFLALATGFVLLLLAIIGFARGSLRPHFNPPLPGGSVAIETVAIFTLSFLALKLFSEFLPTFVGDGAAALLALILQWALVLTILWPIARGVSFRNTLSLWGLHRGRGFLLEVACGIVGYIACLPLLLAGVIVTLVLMVIYQTIRQLLGLPPPPAPSNPIFEMVAQRSWIVIVLVFLLASVWAPLVEEIVFRGALYRHLRANWHWLIAGIVTALAFGVMHGYQLFMLGPVIALGFGFALLREWRGSIIASMTAHAIHNSVVLLILLTVLRTILG